ncbi:hypothetical protein ACROYT_G032320 [Oculina patagonica]
MKYWVTNSREAPVAKASRSDMLTFSTAVQSPQQGFYSPESKSFCQTTATPVSLSVKPPFYRDVSSPGYVPLFQHKPASFDYSMTPSPVATSVTWSTFPGPGWEIPPAVSSQVGDSSVVLTSTPGSICHDKLAQTPHKSNFAAPSNHSQPSYVTQWAPATRSTSTPYFGGPSRNTGNSLQVEEPVDAFIDKLNDGQETVFQFTFTGLQTDSNLALLRAQEQQRLPPLELFKFTGKPIEWPKFIERFRDQIHNKTTLIDSDRMAYLFQNLNGEAKKAVESLSVTVCAYLNDMLNSTYVPSNDRQAMRDYYYQVKACTTWCVKMGQSAILQTPEYLSRATMRLPMNLRVRWYEHIDGHSERSTLVEFEKWLCERVETLFNPLEDSICEEWNKKQRPPKLKPGLKLSPLATSTEISCDTPSSNCDMADPKQAQTKFLNKEQDRKAPSTEKKCVICKHKHPVAYFPVFKSKHLQERRKIAWDHEQ